MTIEKTLFAAADNMPGSMDLGECNHVSDRLLILRYISVAFHRKYDGLRIIEAEKQVEGVV